MGFHSKTIWVRYGYGISQQLMPSYYPRKYLSAGYYIREEFISRLVNGTGNGQSICGGGKGGGSNGESVALTALKRRQKLTKNLKEAIKKGKRAGIRIDVNIETKVVIIGGTGGTYKTLADYIDEWEKTFNSTILYIEHYVKNETLINTIIDQLQANHMDVLSATTFKAGGYDVEVDFSFDLDQVATRLGGNIITDKYIIDAMESDYYGINNPANEIRFNMVVGNSDPECSNYLNNSTVMEGADVLLTAIVDTDTSIYGYVDFYDERIIKGNFSTVYDAKELELKLLFKADTVVQRTLKYKIRRVYEHILSGLVGNIAESWEIELDVSNLGVVNDFRVVKYELFDSVFLSEPESITWELDSSFTPVDLRGIDYHEIWSDNENYSCVRGLPYYTNPMLGNDGADLVALEEVVENMQYDDYEAGVFQVPGEAAGYETLRYRITVHGDVIDVYMDAIHESYIDENGVEQIYEETNYNIAKIFVNDVLMYNMYPDNLSARKSDFEIIDIESDLQYFVVTSTGMLYTYTSFNIEYELDGVTIKRMVDFADPAHIVYPSQITVLNADETYMGDPSSDGSSIVWWAILPSLKAKNAFTPDNMYYNLFYRKGLKLNMADGTVRLVERPEVYVANSSTDIDVDSEPTFIPFGTYQWNKRYLHYPLVLKGFNSNGDVEYTVPPEGEGATDEEKEADLEKKMTKAFKRTYPQDTAVNFKPYRYAMNGSRYQQGKNMQFGNVDRAIIDKMKADGNTKIQEWFKSLTSGNVWERNKWRNQRLERLNNNAGRIYNLIDITNTLDLANYKTNYYVQQYVLKGITGNALKNIYSCCMQEVDQDWGKYSTDGFFGYAGNLFGLSYVSSKYSVQYIDLYIAKKQDLDQEVTMLWKQAAKAPFNDFGVLQDSNLVITVKGNLKTRTFDTIEEFKIFVAGNGPYRSTTNSAIEQINTQFERNKSTIFSGTFPTSFGWGTYSVGSAGTIKRKIDTNYVRPETTFGEWILNVLKDNAGNTRDQTLTEFLNTSKAYPTATMMCWGFVPSQPTEHDGTSFVEVPYVPEYNLSGFGGTSRLIRRTDDYNNPYGGINLDVDPPTPNNVLVPKFATTTRQIFIRCDKYEKVYDHGFYRTMCTQPVYETRYYGTGSVSEYFNQYLIGYTTPKKSPRQRSSFAVNFGRNKSKYNFATLTIPSNEVLYAEEIFNRAVWYLYCDKDTGKYRYIQLTHMDTKSRSVHWAGTFTAYFDPPVEAVIPLSYAIIRRLGWRERLMMTRQYFMISMGVVEWSYKKRGWGSILRGVIKIVVGIIITIYSSGALAYLGKALIAWGIADMLALMGVSGWAAFIINIIISIITMNPVNLISSIANMAMFFAGAAIMGYITYTQYRTEKLLNQIEMEKVSWNVEMKQKFSDMSETVRAIYNQIGEEGAKWGELIAEEHREASILNSIATIICPNGYIHQTLEGEEQALAATITAVDVTQLIQTKIGFYGE
jgi:hypothetical protein